MPASLPTMADVRTASKILFKDGLTSEIYQRCTLLGLIAGRGRTAEDSTFAADGVGEWLNVNKSAMKSKIDTMNLGRWYEGKFQYQKSLGSGYVQEGGVIPSNTNANDDLFATYVVYSANLMTPIKIDKLTWQHAAGPAGWGDLLNQAVTQSRVEHLEKIGSDLWDGTPSSYSPSGFTYSSIPGLKEICSASNNYLGIDRDGGETYETEWQGQTVSGATTIDLASVAKFPLTYNILKYTSEKGYFLTDATVFGGLMEEAIEKQSLITNEMPEFGKYGIKKEGINAGGIGILFDPECPTGDGCYITPSTFNFVMNKSANMEVGEWTKANRQGDNNTMESNITSEIMFFNTMPKFNVYFDNLSV